MCGIAGILTRQQADQESVRRAVAALGHRGPDDDGVHAHQRCLLAHTRLSIIDLAGGHQPLFADEGRLVLVANGEIYNHVELRAELETRGHRFATHSDCEVILHAYREYGLDCLQHLAGMFAFALYDAGEDRLLLARDRLGIKPLFVRRTADGLGFASELKALWAMHGPPEIDPRGFAEYLQQQFNSGRTTIDRNCQRLLPGEAMCIDRKFGEKRWQYWSALDVQTRDTDQVRASREFDALMETVMRQHMRTDVPFGLFLSGGVDSSILLALLSRFSEQPIRTFSIGFRSDRIDDAASIAVQTAQRYHSDHREIYPGRDELYARLPYTVWAADELMRDYASLPTAILAETAGAELKVVFSGEGGDEVFAGYGRYRSSFLERSIKGLLAPGSGGFRSRGALRGSQLSQLLRPELLAAARQARQVFVDAWSAAPSYWSRLQRMQYTDLSTALPDNLLVKVDRMLMASGVEGRVPFLDHRVVEFGLGLPDWLKTDRRQGKLFLKRWAEQYVSREVLYRHKAGFHVPVGDWFRGEFLHRLQQVLPAHPAIRSWFRGEAVAQVLDRQRRNGSATRLLWSLLQFAIWYGVFIEGDGRRPALCQDPIEFIG